MSFTSSIDVVSATFCSSGMFEQLLEPKVRNFAIAATLNHLRSLIVPRDLRTQQLELRNRRARRRLLALDQTSRARRTA